MFDNNVLNEYVWSSVITFVAAFGAAILPSLGDENMTQAALFALLSVGARAGVRAVLNLLTTKFATVSSKPTAV